jgi:hypothetical protein
MTQHQGTDASHQRLLLDSDPQALVLPRLLRAQRLRLFYGDLHNHRKDSFWKPRRFNGSGGKRRTAEITASACA